MSEATPKHGRFIVFEGIDGSGSTTQSELLHQYFLNRDGQSHLTFEPSTGPIGTMIRQILFGRINIAKGQNPFNEQSSLFSTQMAHLYAADRHDHLYNDTDGVITMVKQGINVTCARYVLSSMAYQSDVPSERDLVHNLNKYFPEPDLVIYLDNTVEASMARMNRRSVKDEYEKAEKQNQVKANYDRILAFYDGKVLRIDARLPINTIHQMIVEHIEKLGF